MEQHLQQNLYEDAGFEKETYRLFRQFFQTAERKRRWSLENDIPWDKCSKSLNPAIADVVESFCAVELFLPDYLGSMLPSLHGSRGLSWFAFNWGYEESKHSLALEDWLLKSGVRTESQLDDVQKLCADYRWNLPEDSRVAMACYTMAQELATAVAYRNLAAMFGPQDDPALHRLLDFITVDERAHYGFYRRLVQLHLQADRAGTIEQLKRVLHNFSMPAIGMIADGQQRMARIRDLHIMDEDVYLRDVYMPTLAALGIERHEMRNRSLRKSLQGV